MVTVRKATPMGELGERIASLSASFEAEKEYQHERWHKLDNDLTPVVNLPRDIAKLQGLFEGRISAVTREIERSITVAVEKAIEPLRGDLSSLEGRVHALETAQVADKTAKGVIVWFFQSPLIGWLAAVGAIIWTKIGGKP